jgi:hypothetical protein
MRAPTQVRPLPKSGRRWGIRKTKADPSGKTGPRDDSFGVGTRGGRETAAGLKAPFEAPSKLGTSQGKPFETQGEQGKRWGI